MNKQILLRYGIKQALWVRLRLWAVAVVVVCITAGLFVWLHQPAASPTGTPAPEQARTRDLLQLLLLIVGFIFGFIQWVLARYEASLEKFYERLDMANRRLGTMVEQSWSRAPPDVV